MEEGRDWLRDLLEWLLQELLNNEFIEFMAAEPYERSEERQGYRNGYRQRDFLTLVGRFTLHVPRDPEWCFSTQLAEHRKRLRTTNSQERYQQEVRRQIRVVRIFPNRVSCLRLTSA